MYIATFLWESGETFQMIEEEMAGILSFINADLHIYGELSTLTIVRCDSDFLEVSEERNK